MSLFQVKIFDLFAAPTRSHNLREEALIAEPLLIEIFSQAEQLMLSLSDRLGDSSADAIRRTPGSPVATFLHSRILWMSGSSHRSLVSSSWALCQQSRRSCKRSDSDVPELAYFSTRRSSAMQSAGVLYTSLKLLLVIVGLSKNVVLHLVALQFL